MPAFHRSPKYLLGMAQLICVAWCAVVKQLAKLDNPQIDRCLASAPKLQRNSIQKEERNEEKKLNLAWV